MPPRLPLVSSPLRDLCGHVWPRLHLGCALSTLDCELPSRSLTPLESPLAGGFDSIYSEMNTYEKRGWGSPQRGPLYLRELRPGSVNNVVETLRRSLGAPALRSLGIRARRYSWSGLAATAELACGF